MIILLGESGVTETEKHILGTRRVASMMIVPPSQRIPREYFVQKVWAMSLIFMRRSTVLDPDKKRDNTVQMMILALTSMVL